MLFGFIERIVRVTRLSACLALALIGALLCVRWSAAQTAGKPARKPNVPDPNLAFEQLVGFVNHLQNTGQTNALRLFDDYSHAFLAQQHSAQLDTTAWTLLRLREGRTNEVIRMLELQLTSEAISFVTSFRNLPGPLREKLSLTPLGHARDYCSQYHVKSTNAEIAQIEANAFALLDEEPSK